MTSSRLLGCSFNLLVIWWMKKKAYAKKDYFIFSKNKSYKFHCFEECFISQYAIYGLSLQRMNRNRLSLSFLPTVFICTKHYLLPITLYKNDLLPGGWHYLIFIVMVHCNSSLCFLYFSITAEMREDYKNLILNSLPTGAVYT